MPDVEDCDLTMRICREIDQTKGIITVGELAEKLDKSRQKINREFLHYTELGIKEYSVTVRMCEAMVCKMKNPSVSLTDLAYQFGYFNQAHFIHDIKRYTGVTPSNLFSL